MRNATLTAGLAAAAVFATLAAAPVAHAQRASITSGRLLGLCVSKDARSVEGCEAYVNGVSDAASVYQALRPEDGSKGDKLPDYLCVPTATTGRQLREKVVEFIRAHGREEGNRPAGGVVLRALAEAYPCKGGK